MIRFKNSFFLSFLKNQMSDHIELSCGVTAVDCTFAHIGCDVKVSYFMSAQ